MCRYLSAERVANMAQDVCGDSPRPEVGSQNPRVGSDPDTLTSRYSFSHINFFVLMIMIQDDTASDDDT